MNDEIITKNDFIKWQINGCEKAPINFCKIFNQCKGCPYSEYLGCGE